jgi:DNA ligase D-like protein (predicted 3'-phosphoesterase)
MNRFVIHKHAASTLHYDLRFEVGDVLKCWTVPKGPSTAPGVKRLAIPVEDHEAGYIDFEGIIPEGEYGAGTVIVWDTGTYVNLTEKAGSPVPVEQGIEDGHIKVWLNGSKLRGGFALTRFERGKKVYWLLVKVHDEEANPDRDPVRDEPESVLSGRTIEAVEKEAAGQSG